MKSVFLIMAFLGLSHSIKAQYNKGINFQGVARYSNGMIVSNKTINLRLSIINDTLTNKVEYQEIKSVTTNILGLFTVVVGSQEIGKIITSNYFETINWSSSDKYLKVEADLTGDFSFIPLGQQKINYVPFAFYADKVDAKNVIGILSIVQGGTGLSSIKDIKTNWQLDKVNNAADGRVMDIAANMPYGTTGIKIIDWLKGVQKKFNLVMYPNKTKPNQFITRTILV